MTSHGGLREWSHGAFAVLILVVLLGKEDPGVKLAVPALFSLIGGSLVVGSAMLLPRWAREQERRMEHISRHAASLLDAPGGLAPLPPLSDDETERRLQEVQRRLDPPG